MLLQGAIEGVVLAIIVAVIELLWDGWRPRSAVLGTAQRIDRLVLLRWDAPLFFANAECFQERVLREHAGRLAHARCARLVVAAEPVTSVDVTAADMLRELDEPLQDQGIELCFAEMKGPVKDKLKRFGLFSHFGQQAFFATIDDAVRAYRAAQPESGRRALRQVGTGSRR